MLKELENLLVNKASKEMIEVEEGDSQEVGFLGVLEVDFLVGLEGSQEDLEGVVVDVNNIKLMFYS